MENEMRKELEKRVKHVVSLSKEIPWYVRKYKELGIDPDEIRKPEDLLKAYEKGLYTTPADLSELVYYKHPEAKGPFYTSGTTGKPKEIWLNPDDEKYFIAQGEKVWEAFISKNDRILSFFPGEPAMSGYWAYLTLSSLGYNFYSIHPQEARENPEKIIKAYKELTPTVVMGLTTFMYRMPLILSRLGVEVENLNIDKILVAAEPSTVERRKRICEEMNCRAVQDTYASSENGVIAIEKEPFTDEHIILPEVLTFLTKDLTSIEENETGEIILTNLLFEGAKPYRVLLNYKIGDWAKCKGREGDIVTSISEIRREAAYLAGAKLNPQEVEKCLEELEGYKNELTGEYLIINYFDSNRKAVGEIRIESKRDLPLENRRTISEILRKRIYSANFPVWNEVENTKNAELLINITNPGELYKGYEQFIKPGKPKRLIVPEYA